MEELDELLFSFTEKASNALDDKLKEACIAWGVDLSNPEEIKRRCEVTIQENNPLRELRIDGCLVMLFSDWITEPFDMNSKELKMNMSFKCSEIATPEIYKL